MAFNQYNLERVHDQSRGGFDLFVYHHDTDTIADITASGYFDPELFGFKSPGNNPKLIKVNCADGPYEVQLAGGVASVVSSPAEGITSDVTWTVGTGGNFSTINDALAFYLSIGKGLTASNPKITINLLPGFVMAEQIIADGINLSGCTITSDDAEVTIQRSALAATNIPNLDYSSTPAFLAVNGGSLPIIAALFNMDTTGSADNTKQHGVMAAWGSFVHVERGCGVKNATGRGLYLVNSTAYARASVWDGAGTYGVRAGNASTANIREGSATGCGLRSVYVAGASSVTMQDFNGSGSLSASGLDANLVVTNCSVVHAQNANLSNGASHNALFEDGGSGDLKGANLSNAGDRGVNAIASGLINLKNCNITNAADRAINLAQGSKANCQSADGTGFGGSAAFVVFSGSILTANGATGTLSQTANTLNTNGIIFQ